MNDRGFRIQKNQTHLKLENEAENDDNSYSEWN